MLFEPTTNSGTYLFGRPTTSYQRVQGGGLNGVWVGMAAAPLAEHYDLNHRATWRLDMAFRTGRPQKNLWTAKNGKRGAAPGGGAMKISTAFSSDRATGNPYLRLSWQKEFKVTVDIFDEDGFSHGKNVDLQPASSLDMLGGIEVVAVSSRDRNTRIAVDFFAGATYKSWEDIASGVYLPNTLNTSDGIAVTASEHLKARSGLALDIHGPEYIRSRTGALFQVETPFRQEHIYNVYTTPMTYTLGWFFTLQGVSKANQASDTTPPQLF
jgi:hypothetical protein